MLPKFVILPNICMSSKGKIMIVNTRPMIRRLNKTQVESDRLDCPKDGNHPFQGEWLDFHCYISMVRVSYSAVSVSLFYPLPHHRHLSSFARPPPPPLSSFVIFWLTPNTQLSEIEFHN